MLYRSVRTLSTRKTGWFASPDRTSARGGNFGHIDGRDVRRRGQTAPPDPEMGRCRLFDLQFGRLDHLAPAVDLLEQHPLEVLRRFRDRIRPELHELPA